ncbi:MAG TPA: replication-associated recombination protein A [Saprospiraceae bacterium]|nr:replication-associated recombination protein A [Saprospiraceae bacterium]
MGNLPPLAERMRPKMPSEYVGQRHLMDENASFRRLLEHKKVHSCIFWGPPGVGKTSLALMIAEVTEKQIYVLSAVNAGVKDVRDTIEKASKPDLFRKGDSPILFIDEIHRFNKSQQDALLEAVEKGIVILIGATTENPSFEVNQALLSRCQVYILEEFSASELISMVDSAIQKDAVLSQQKIEVKEYDALVFFSGGDARKLYNILELIASAHSHDELIITNALVEENVKVKHIAYDKGGEFHYDIISAFIKSVRGSQPDAALYYMARMLLGGEDPMFICRRMVILASEDIGLANPNALLIAQACMDAVHKIGMPESRIVMGECVIYLASSPKSNTAYMAINQAFDLVNKSGNLAVPLHLRNAPTKLMKELGYGDGYKYAHSYEGNFIDQEYLPKEIANTFLYHPGNNANESKMKEFLKARWPGKYE